MGTKGTTSHVYFLDELLGTGSSASVYVGRNRKSGQLCAVKVYSSWNYTQAREFQTMRMLNHDNIIKFISIEPESISKKHVLIMELSTGGSVLNMLGKPEFAFGFPEDEFLVFLKDITSALKYLRENMIVHRDIKPGNILRFFKEDMSSQFKLTDFGAARELKGTDEFTSIYGTEEYLDPRAYQCALLSSNKSPQSFDSSIDLWSLGVTLYHVATGCLPFLPYGGRKNREDMFLMTSKKSSGMISGIQRHPDGPIEWSGDLPDTCLLSRSLKKELTRILAGLIEIDSKLRWVFEVFFQHSVKITSKEIFQVVSICDFTMDRIYADHQNLTSSFRFIEFLKSDQQLSSLRVFHPYLSVDEVLENCTLRRPSSSSPQTIFLYILPYEGWNVKSPSAQPPLKPPEIKVTKSMFSDYKYSVKSLSYVFFLRRKGEMLVELIGHLEVFLFAASKDMIRDVSRLKEVLDVMGAFCPDARSMFASLFGDVAQVAEISCFDGSSRAVVGEEGREFVQRDRSTSEDEQKSPSYFGQLFESMKLWKSESRSLLRLCREKTTTAEINKFTKIYEELSTISEKFRSQSLSEQKNEVKLTHNEYEIHKFDKKRAAGLNVAAEELHADLVRQAEKYLKQFERWFREYSRKKILLERSLKCLGVVKSAKSISSSKGPSVKPSSQKALVRFNGRDRNPARGIQSNILDVLNDLSKVQEEFHSKNSNLTSIVDNLQLRNNYFK